MVRLPGVIPAVMVTQTCIPLILAAELHVSIFGGLQSTTIFLVDYSLSLVCSATVYIHDRPTATSSQNTFLCMHISPRFLPEGIRKPEFVCHSP